MIKTKGFSSKIDPAKKEIESSINTKIYPLAAIYQAAYFFLDKVYVFLDGEPKKEIKVLMKLKSASDDGSPRLGSGQALTKTTLAELEKIAGEFYNELLNQLLREKVNATNAKIREYIVAQALYSAVPNEVDELLKEVEEEDWQEDPLGIAKTWESSQAKATDDKKALKGKGKKK
jgi:hypothetical protein